MTQFEAKPDGKPGRFAGKPRPFKTDHEAMGQLFDRTPPHATEAEKSLLGSILLDPGVLNDVVEILPSPDSMYKEAHATIYKALVDTFDAHQSGDLVQLTETLRARGVLDRVGGTGYLMELAEAVPSAASAPYYAKLIADAARLRKLIDAAGEILHDAYTGSDGTPDSAKRVIDVAEKKIFDIASEDVNAEPENLKELLHQEMTRILEADGKPVQGIPTGFPDLDEMTSGLQPEELMILAARPSMGKTAFSLNLAEQIAFGGRTPFESRKGAKPVPVGIFSLEMSRGSLVQRLLSARSGVDASKLRSGQVSESEFRKLNDAAAELSEAPMIIDDTPGMTVLTLRAKARRMKQRHGIGCIVIDYLQLLSSPGSARDSRQVEVSEISRSIKALARELKVPVICLAQLNRGAEQREGNRPRMSDLRESGSIEQDADVVALLHRESYYHRGDPAWDPNSPEFDEENRDKLNLAELILAKQRNGPTGTVKLVWDSSVVRFKNHDGRHVGGSQGFSPDFAPADFGGGDSGGGDGFSGGGGGFGGGGYETPDFDPNPVPRNEAPPPVPEYRGFAPGKKSGPEADFRDGSGNDVDFDDDELPPF